MKYLFLFLLWMVGAGPRVTAQEMGPRYFAAPPGALAETKARLAAGDPALKRAL